MTDVLDEISHALAVVAVALAEGEPVTWRAVANGLDEARRTGLRLEAAGADREAIVGALLAAHDGLAEAAAERHGWLLEAPWCAPRRLASSARPRCTGAPWR